MKFYLLFFGLLVAVSMAAQEKNAGYPLPEFSNEINYFDKDSIKLMRLEKGSSKMENKAKGGGFGGVEYGYTIDGEKSVARLKTSKSHSFAYVTETSGKSSSAMNDSLMRSQGIDPSMMAVRNDPSTMITLYKTETVKDARKIYMMKSGGAFSKGKNKSSDKFTFSVKKIMEGYWELIPDKTLPKGEYSFVVMGMMSMDGSATIFSFAIE